MRAGSSELALLRLRDYMKEHALELRSMRADALLDRANMTEVRVARGELLALFAAAAADQADRDAALLARGAEVAGVQMRALALPRRSEDRPADRPDADRE
jgi:hypothetical protein